MRLRDRIPRGQTVRMSLKQEVMLCVAFDTATATNSGELVPSCLKIMNRARRAHLLEGAAPAETNTQPNRKFREEGLAN
jgi:hypothetical protein